MNLMILKFLDEEIQRILAWVIHRESASEELHGANVHKFTNLTVDYFEVILDKS